MHYIFDFDGTLADSQQCSILATQAAFKASGYTIPPEEQITHFMGIPIEQSFQEMTTTALSSEDLQALITSFRAYYKQFENESLTLFPNITDVLATLQKQQALCFVVSSKKTDVLKRNLQQLHIDMYFKDCIGSDQVQHYKPHPEGILLLLERYDLQPAECVMIGDAIFDIQMGKAANCRTCAVTWGSHTKATLQMEQPDFIVDQVKGLLHIK